MRPRSARVTRFAVSARVVAQRFAFLLLFSTAIALMLMGKGDNPFVQRLRATIADAAAPVLRLMAEPAATVDAAVTEVRTLASLRQENAALRADNERLLRWQGAARALEQENLVLRKLLEVKVSARTRDVVAARVIGDSGGPFVRTVLLDAGSDDGVRPGQAAVNHEGLVGRVVETGKDSARLLLLTDLNSRVPVLVETSRERAILTGDNSDLARLIYVASSSRVHPGDRIVTSGHGGMFPPGLPIGSVSSVSDGVPRVQPFVTWNKLEFVRVLELERPADSRSPGAGAPVGQW